MNAPVARQSWSIALVGNPNTGKSTLFTALSGIHQQTGNYPGVTVEKKLGHFDHAGKRLVLVDLPGTYSLAPRSPDEMLAVDLLLGRRDDAEQPQAVLCVVDAANLERNLYLVSQVLELGLPTVIALNMMDLAEQRGVVVDVPRLEQQLGVKVVPVQGHKRVGLDALKHALAAAVEQSGVTPPSPFPEPFQRELATLQTAFKADRKLGDAPRYLVERLLLDTSGYLEDSLLVDGSAALRESVKQARGRLGAIDGCQVPAVEPISRYRWIDGVVSGVVRRPSERRETSGDRLDRWLTHWFTGSLTFLALMFVMFQAVFEWAGPLMDLIDGGTGAVGEWLGSMLPEGALRSLVVDGIVAGVGGVIIFLPQIMILFGFVAVLEECGYMARAAYLMDKLMTKVGLSGKSFIPMLSSFACAIPGIMATRVIENRRDRLTTILVAPLMSCSARLPVYVLLIAAFIPDTHYAGGVIGLQGVTMLAMYLVGVVAAVIVAFALKRTLLRGPTPPFVLELPSYKWPSVQLVVSRMIDRGWAFVKNAGTLIVAVSVIVWAALYFPQNTEALRAPFVAQLEPLEQKLPTLKEGTPEHQAVVDELAEIETRIKGAQRRQSILGRAGRAIEPVFRPLGWDWRITCAAIASFPAREVIVATLGILYDLGDELDVGNEEDRTRLGTALASATWDGTDRPVFNTPVALSIMVFFALCAQCASTLAVIRRETNSWGWPVFTFVYMTVLAYVASLVTYQVGMAIGGG
ncbi:MAG: ferrous iron transport protein B [Planctomycetaceae bacterium]|nr:ferrous iron transport protein B [Planctomycetaceae bacterium]